MDEYVDPNNHQDDQKYHGEHESHQRNNTNDNINPPQENNNDVSQEHEMYPIE